jgi:hypothetical protein
LTKDNNVHVVVYGNFTPAQRHLVKSWCMIHGSQFKEVFDWVRQNILNYTD